MTSYNRQTGTYLHADDSTDIGTDHETPNQRHATVYDAVAGRVSLKFSKESAPSGSRKTSSGHHQLADPVLAPEEVLFARKHAPQRYAEKDVYFAHEGLPDNGVGTLPDSDILKAVHGYTSHFYEALGRRETKRRAPGGRRVDERSLDETALLAFGILLEEAARDSLGKSGDLVFTEGVEDDADMGKHSEFGRCSTSRRTEVGWEGHDALRRRKHKRRKH